MLAGLAAASDRAAFIAGYLERMGPRFERYCVLLSSRGDSDFAKRAREAMVVRWCDKLGIEYVSLSADCRRAIRFAMGGSISVFADHGEGEPFDVAAFADMASDMVQIIARRLPELRLPCAEERWVRMVRFI